MVSVIRIEFKIEMLQEDTESQGVAVLYASVELALPP
jgi:hypothetical protein